MHLVFASIVLIMSVFALESPRWLAKAGRNEQAASTLSKLRKLPADHAYVQGELADIHEELDREREATGVGFLAILKELFTLKANKYRIWLCLTCHLLSRKSQPERGDGILVSNNTQNGLVLSRSRFMPLHFSPS